MDEKYLEIEINNDLGIFKSIVNKYLPKIEEVKKEEKKPRSERQDYTTQLLTLINFEQKKLGKKLYDYRYFAFKISHIPTKDLYHCIKNYKNNALFFWSIKAK